MLDLGGLFGELAWGHEFCPWGIRVDMTEFLSKNKMSKSKFIYELYDWFYVDSDSQSFRATSKVLARINRDRRTISLADLQLRLPETYKAYQRFIKFVDHTSFWNHVDEIWKLKMNF